MGRHDDSSCDTVLVLGLALYGGDPPPPIPSDEEYASRRLAPKQEDGHLQSPPGITNKQQQLEAPTGGANELSLTLALSGEASCYGVSDTNLESHKPSQTSDVYQYSSSSTLFSHHHHHQPQQRHLPYANCRRSLSSTSTFSNSCLSSGAAAIKRERHDAGAAEAEVEVEMALGGAAPSPHAGAHAGDDVLAADEVDEEAAGGGCARKKLRLTKEQSALLEERFKEQSTLNPKQKLALAKQLNLRPRQVEVWFQNRRARTKLKQTEVDCEFLRRCCETLADENRRLHRELQELKAIKFTAAGTAAAVTPTQPAPYRQVPVPPAAAFTMCPGCQRISAVTAGTDVINQAAAGAAGFAVAPKSAHVM